MAWLRKILVGFFVRGIGGRMPPILRSVEPMPREPIATG